MSYFALQALNALSFSVLLLLAGLGLTLVLSVMNFINLAHGSFFLLGAYVATFWLGWGAVPPSLWWLAFVVAALAVGLLGWLLDRFPLRLFYARTHLMQVLLTYGLLIIGADLMRWVFGADTLSPQLPAWLRGGVWIGGLPFPVYRLFLIAVGVVLTLALWLLLERSRWGSVLRACVSDRAIAETLGIHTTAVFTLAMALSAALGGLGGALGAGILSVHPGLDEDMLLLTLLVVVIGGLGSLRGTVVAALVIGLATTLASIWLPEFSGALTLAVMLLLLLWRPAGLLQRARRAV